MKDVVVRTRSGNDHEGAYPICEHFLKRCLVRSPDWGLLVRSRALITQGPGTANIRFDARDMASKYQRACRYFDGHELLEIWMQPFEPETDL